MPKPVTLIKGTDRYFDCYPCAARLGNGDLLITFCRRPIVGGRVMPEAFIAGIRSTDNGLTWSEAFTLIDTPDHGDADPNIVAWENKVLVISTAVPMGHMTGQGVTTLQFLAIRSENNGQTWSKPTEISHAPYVYCSGKINPGVRFPDGTLAFGFCADMNLQKGAKVTGDNDLWGESGVLISGDDGRSWTIGKTVGIRQSRSGENRHAANGLDEPALAVCKDGSLYMLMRTGLEQLYEARSTDQGRTWGPPQPTTLVAHDCPADLCVFDHPQLGRGWLVIYDHSPKNRYPLAVAVSLDEGRTWTKPMIVADYGARSAYPACVQTAGGNILLVWQQDIHRESHPTCKDTREVWGCLLGLDEVGQIVRGNVSA